MFSSRHAPTMPCRLLGATPLLLAVTFAPAADKKDTPPAKEPATKARQASRERPVVSPQIHADRRVTFRLRAPNAKEVKVSGAGPVGNKPLTRDTDGIWSITIGPIGKADGLLKRNEQTEKILQAHTIRHAYRVTEGDHTWPVWRKHLAEIAPLLFVD